MVNQYGKQTPTMSRTNFKPTQSTQPKVSQGNNFNHSKSQLQIMNGTPNKVPAGFEGRTKSQTNIATNPAVSGSNTSKIQMNLMNSG